MFEVFAKLAILKIETLYPPENLENDETEIFPCGMTKKSPVKALGSN
jgi:hypothetical protein